MRSAELTVGRTFGVTFDHGDDFFEALAAFCQSHEIRQGYVPMFIGAFAEAELVGTCERIARPEEPLWSRTHVESVEALGCGTLAQDPATGVLLPHIHVTAGLKARSADGLTSHLLSARVQFLSELLIVEIKAPMMTRPANPGLFGVPLLTFDGGGRKPA